MQAKKILFLYGKSLERTFLVDLLKMRQEFMKNVSCRPFESATGVHKEHSLLTCSCWPKLADRYVILCDGLCLTLRRR